MKQNERIPSDTAYNKLFPFPNKIPKKVAIVLLLLIAAIFSVGLVINIFRFY